MQLMKRYSQIKTIKECPCLQFPKPSLPCSSSTPLPKKQKRKNKKSPCFTLRWKFRLLNLTAIHSDRLMEARYALQSVIRFLQHSEPDHHLTVVSPIIAYALQNATYCIWKGRIWWNQQQMCEHRLPERKRPTKLPQDTWAGPLPKKHVFRFERNASISWLATRWH